MDIDISEMHILGRGKHQCYKYVTLEVARKLSRHATLGLQGQQLFHRLRSSALVLKHDQAGQQLFFVAQHREGDVPIGGVLNRQERRCKGQG